MHKLLIVLVGVLGIGIGIGMSFFILPESRGQEAGVAGAFAEHVETLEMEKEGSSRELFDVVKVIDGDTVTLSMHGKNETLRLIGIDTPETGDSRGNVECFAKEATEKLKEVISERVAIEKDDSQGERDRYGRLLAYLFSESGKNLNQLLIEEGYASEYTYNDPYKYQSAFKAAEQAAKEEKKGLWADNACPEQKKPVVKKEEARIAPAAQSAPVPQPTSTPLESTAQLAPEKEPPMSTPPPTPPPPAPQQQSKYTCSSNTYNCSDFKTKAEAQAVYDQCGGAGNDIHKLDSNKDGEACESLP